MDYFLGTVTTSHQNSVRYINLVKDNLTIKNCDKTFRKNIIKRLKNTTFRCTLHHYQVKLKMQDCSYKYKNGQ